MTQDTLLQVAMSTEGSHLLYTHTVQNWLSAPPAHMKVSTLFVCMMNHSRATARACGAVQL